MIKKNFNSIEWLEFELLASCPEIEHKLFLKSGGFSQDCYASLNMSYHCGDQLEAVNKNRKASGIEHYVGGFHVHGASVAEVTSSAIKEIPSCDALMTHIPGIGLLTTHADCQTALFYDPINRVVANVHSGWRGNVQNIYSRTIEALHNRYGSKPENLLVGVGPSLGPQHAQFIHYKTELPESFWEFRARDCYFNFWEIARIQLKNAGVLEHHIEIAEICTFSNPTDFFSYRRDKQCGRHATTIKLISAKS